MREIGWVWEVRQGEGGEGAGMEGRAWLKAGEADMGGRAGLKGAGVYTSGSCQYCDGRDGSSF